ncbi:hypothetical protein EUTSA_v10027152mg [Eutrema salsugineum]|uniref:Uncharacterized protein n=1 Tax=Eutrema salsugineum TaxID=72664 RepID=V4P4M3_EUTSA|nr:putative cell wall protein [Eutrema salsugineum]ESQ54441.1 hypothetical protein EUTSA_v10027152mg [Eutrema salsugineum]
MVTPLQTLIAISVLVSLFIGCTEKVSGMRYIPNTLDTTEIKHSEFLVNIVPQPSGLIPGLGWFLLPPQPKTPIHTYKDPLAAAPVTSCGISNQFAPNPGYEAPNPSSGEDKIPPVPQP